jgi:cellulose synthase/poly-beta-1,6-N-acetylglucosamine synthase-like glycosyltransferase
MNSIETTIAVVTILSAVLIVYHHVVFPWILNRIAGRRSSGHQAVPSRGYERHKNDGTLPSVTVLIPAHNEAEVIADKVRNLAMLDYPADRLWVVIACDGCTDGTADAARQAHGEIEVAHLNLDVVEFPANRGKVAVLNDVLPRVPSDLVALSDASALLSVDALLVAAGHFSDPNVGVVAGTYHIPDHGSEGEAAYWRYQRAVKRGEAALGAPLGVHGAFYMVRKNLTRPLAPDSINDDFILPMTIVADGFRAVSDPEIIALELEKATLAQDFRRRRRIAAGNMQQLVRLRRLLHPRYRGIAFAFASGKALRAVMPFLMLSCLAGSAALGPLSPAFAALYAAQALAYGLAGWCQAMAPRRVPRGIQKIHYLVSGHLAGLIGGTRYILGLERGGWRRAFPNMENQS